METRILTVSISTKKVPKQNRRDLETTAKPRKKQTKTDFSEKLERGRKLYMLGNYSEAMEIWLPLAENGDSEAQAWVGSLYANGDGVDVNSKTAFEWYLKSAEGGNPQAQANIGALYAMGQGVQKDMVYAVKWMRRAARNGDPNAQFNMAVFYAKGDGVKQSLIKAAEWYRKGAENGHYPSQGRLGHMYYVGEGVKKDRIEAYLWLSLAGQHGIGSALIELEKVVGEMSSDEKSAAMQLVDIWRSRGNDNSSPKVFSPIPS